MAAQTFQRTIRGIPKSLDEALRARAKQSGISLNQAAVAALARGIGLSDEPIRHHDLDHLAGTWIEDPAFEQAIADQDTAALSFQ